jgi:hypothetical protein
MKQLTIYCSEELIGQVNQVLHNVGIEDYVHMPGLYGNKLKTKGSFEKDLTYPASAFIVHAPSEKIDGIVAELQDYANQCGIKPCLRMVVISPEQVH